MLNTLINLYGLEKINSLTKYPSILTYHEIDKGILKESLTEGLSFSSDEDVYVTEKIDGANTRLVLLGSDFLIGSRERFLYAKGDRFGDPSLGIVDVVKPIVSYISYCLAPSNITIVFGETYGGSVTSNSREYTLDHSYNFRIFDIASINTDKAAKILEKPIEKIASWREYNGQDFFDVDSIKSFGKEFRVQTVPYLSVVKGNTIPKSLDETYDWLMKYSVTNAGINKIGKAEGVVIRTKSRDKIRKIRFEDYEKTKKRGIF